MGRWCGEFEAWKKSVLVRELEIIMRMRDANREYGGIG